MILDRITVAVRDRETTSASLGSLYIIMNADSVYDSKSCAYQKRDPEFFKCDPENIPGADLV